MNCAVWVGMKPPAFHSNSTAYGQPQRPDVSRLSALWTCEVKAPLPHLASCLAAASFLNWLLCLVRGCTKRSELGSSPPGDCSVWGDHVSVIILSALGGSLHLLGRDQLSVRGVDSVCVCVCFLRVWRGASVCWCRVFLCMRGLYFLKLAGVMYPVCTHLCV